MDRWNTTDEMLKEILKKYNKLNKITQDEIQSVFKSYDFNKDNLFSIADRKTLNRVNRIINSYVEENEIDTYTKYRINKIYGKSRIKNNEILDFLIFICFLKERNKLSNYENKMFQELANIEYRKAQDEVYNLKSERKEIVSLENGKVNEIISKPNPKGYIWWDYIMATILYNSNQIYRQALIDIQQNKTLDIASDIYQNLLKSQRNKYLSIRDDGIISGDLELESLYLVNSSIKEGYLKADSKAKVKFIAEIDKRTTDMCDSLNNQIFNVNDWNTYQRYSADDGRIVTYKTFGLEVGANLPPINNHFHWCRSTIVYQLDMPREEINKNLQTWDEKKAINKWLSSDFYDINKKMYSDIKLTSDEKKLVKDLYRALNKQPYYIANEDEIIVRVLEVDDIAVQNIISSHKLNSVYESKTFESYSLKNGYNPNANVYFYVKGSKKARNMLEYNPMEKEAEVLYQYGTKFITKKYYTKNGKHYFLLEEFE